MAAGHQYTTCIPKWIFIKLDRQNDNIRRPEQHRNKHSQRQKTRIRVIHWARATENKYLQIRTAENNNYKVRTAENSFVKATKMLLSKQQKNSNWCRENNWNIVRAAEKIMSKEQKITVSELLKNCQNRKIHYCARRTRIFQRLLVAGGSVFTAGRGRLPRPSHGGTAVGEPRPRDPVLN